jgi:hypothetical protein
MADTLKTLGQSFPSGNTLTSLYTVPGSTSAAVSSIVVCNQSSTSSCRIRVSVAIAAEADSSKQYIVYDAIIAPNETKAFVIGVTLATTDVVRVQSDSGTASFNLFGAEVS